MASETGEDIWSGIEKLTVTWPNDMKLFSPIIFAVQVGGSQRSTHLKLCINDVCIDKVEIREGELMLFNYENIDLLSVGRGISVEIIGFDIDTDEEFSRAYKTYYISTPTLAESVYCIFRALQDILENGGYDTSEAAGLLSLINILEEI